MKPNRRNLLIGLATATVGGGAAFGSGAFSQVEADRSVTIGTSGDDAALLELSVNGSDYNGLSDNGSNGKIGLDFSALNRDAKTTFTDALTVRNTGNQGVGLDAATSISIDDTEVSGLIKFHDGAKELPTGSSTEPIQLDPAGSGTNTSTLDVIVNLRDQDLSNKTDPSGEVTFIADNADYNG